VYVKELKYLGVHVSAGLCLKFSVEHLRSKFYRTFNCICIYSKSKASNSEMVTVDLLKSYCFPFLFLPLMLCHCPRQIFVFWRAV